MRARGAVFAGGMALFRRDWHRCAFCVADPLAFLHPNARFSLGLKMASMHPESIVLSVESDGEGYLHCLSLFQGPKVDSLHF